MNMPSRVSVSFFTQVFNVCFLFSFFSLAAVFAKGVEKSDQSRPFSQLYSCGLESIKKLKTSHEVLWEIPSTKPFTELLLSWNALRPTKGALTVYVSVYHKHWSKWLKLATWGKGVQRSYLDTSDRAVHAKHVRVEMQPGFMGSGFRIQVRAHDGATVSCLKRLTACLTNDFNLKVTQSAEKLTSVLVKNVPRQSQKTVDHPDILDLCCPTATSMVFWHYVQQKKYPPPANSLKEVVKLFACSVVDRALGGTPYGNWLFNVANVTAYSQGKLIARIHRLENFFELHQYLQKQIPVPVSIKGTITGGFKPYTFGHYIVVIGYDAQRKKVLCLDPAFNHEDEVFKEYPYHEFLTLWGRQKNMSYIITPA